MARAQNVLRRCKNDNKTFFRFLFVYRQSWKRNGNRNETTIPEVVFVCFTMLYLWVCAELLIDLWYTKTKRKRILLSFVWLRTTLWAGLGIYTFQKKATFLRSFAFFSKECNVLAFFCVLYKKNAAFFAFFYLLSKRTLRSLRSLRSFTFFIKECGVLCVLLCSV